jgi:BlaI family penicillinase repressor
MMKRINISEAEWKVMQTLWQNAPLELKDIKAHLTDTPDWSNTTVRTLLMRLVKKGAVLTDKSAGVFKYSPALPKSECVLHETKSFLQRIYHGSAAQFIASLAQHGALSEKERKEIIRIISHIKGGVENE